MTTEHYRLIQVNLIEELYTMVDKEECNWAEIMDKIKELKELRKLKELEDISNSKTI